MILLIMIAYFLFSFSILTPLLLLLNRLKQFHAKNVTKNNAKRFFEHQTFFCKLHTIRFYYSHSVQKHQILIPTFLYFS